MKRQIFLQLFQEKLLEDSALTIFFADFSKKFIKTLNLFIGDQFPNSRYCSFILEEEEKKSNHLLTNVAEIITNI